MRALGIVIAAVLLSACGSSAPEQSTPSGDTTQAAATQAVPRLVDLGSTSCMPCKMMEPILEELRHEYVGRMEVVFIDVSENREAAQSYGIDTIPTQILFDVDGQERWRHVGFIGKEDMLAAIDEAGVNLSAAP